MADEGKNVITGLEKLTHVQRHVQNQPEMWSLSVKQINKQNIKHFGISVRQKQRNLYATFYFRLKETITKKQTKQIP